jgi:hypothetical protein
MAGWRNPGRAERVVVYEEGGERRQYWRAEDREGNEIWCRDAPPAAGGALGETITTEDLLRAIEASLRERRRASRGRKFRL